MGKTEKTIANAETRKKCRCLRWIMASDLISREKLIKEFEEWHDRVGDETVQDRLVQNIITYAMDDVNEAPAVDAIPIDTVAEMLADLFGDEIPCNYNDIDEVLPIGCEKAHCPDDGDHSCWKKYVMHWLKRKMDGGKQDAQETTL